MCIIDQRKESDDRKNIPLKTAVHIKALQAVANIVEYAAHPSGKKPTAFLFNIIPSELLDFSWNSYEPRTGALSNQHSLQLTCGRLSCKLFNHHSAPSNSVNDSILLAGIHMRTTSIPVHYTILIYS